MNRKINPVLVGLDISLKKIGFAISDKFGNITSRSVDFCKRKTESYETRDKKFYVWLEGIYNSNDGIEAIYYNYNILKDNPASNSFLSSIKKLSEKHGINVECVEIGNDVLKKYGLTFKSVSEIKAIESVCIARDDYNVKKQYKRAN